MKKQKYKTPKHKNRGFTLIELLVVMTLIGVIAGLVGPSFFDFYRRKNINYASQVLHTTLSEGFSSARSKNLIFGVEKIKDNKQINFFSCQYPDCASKEILYTEKFLGVVEIVSDDFEIQFFPPHGDIEYFSENDVENTTDETFEIELQNKYTQKIKIYKNSGLIEKIQ